MTLSGLRRLGSIFRRLHRDEGGQLMPLIMFLAIAFYTSVALVVNVGYSTREKIAAQNAVDAAAVSGANALARGMNYLASNNITQSKLLATIIIVRAFDPAITDALETLDKVEKVANGMIQAGTAMLGTPAAAAGTVLIKAGNVLLFKIHQERPILLLLRIPMQERIGLVPLFWDNEPYGLAWTVLKALQRIADDIARSAPVIAQVTAGAIYEHNMTRFNAGEAWLVPLYPALPVCKGKFADFAEPTRKTTQEYAEWVYRKARFMLLLSRFNAHYKRHLQSEFNELFTNQGSLLGPLADPALKRVEAVTKRVEEMGREIENLADQVQDLEDQLQDLRSRQSGGEEDLENSITSAEQAIRRTQESIDRLNNSAKRLAEDAQKITTSQASGDRGQMPPTLSGLLGMIQDRSDLYPYLLDGSGYPGTFTVFALGYRGPQEMMASSRFEPPSAEGSVFAAARVYNPTRADLWTPDWRAKLVAADRSYLRTENGREPAPCASAGGSPGSYRVRRARPRAPSDSVLSSQMARLLNELNHH